MPEDWALLLVQKVDLLVLDHFHELALNLTAWSKGPSDILRVLFSNILSNLLNQLLLDGVDDLQEWPLSPLADELSSHFDVVFQDVLV